MTNKLMVLLKQTLITDTHNSRCIIYYFPQSGSALTGVHLLSYLGPMGEGREVNLLNPPRQLFHQVGLLMEVSA